MLARRHLPAWARIAWEQNEFAIAFVSRTFTRTIWPYSFGICMLLLTIKQPHPTKIPTIGCTSPPNPRSQIPPGTPWLPPSTMPLHTHQAMPDTMPKEVGIGVPSKYLLLPVLSFGREDTVTLKRARRVSPQRTKKERNKVSSGVRSPRAKAQAAGATPKEI